MSSNGYEAERGQIEHDAREADDHEKPRFGERLREWLCNEWLDIKATDDAGLRDLADAIDRDAASIITTDDAVDSLLAQRDALRQKIEQLVEELRFSIEAPWAHGEDRDVIGAGEILERLSGIFEGGSIGAADTQSSA